MRDLTHTFSPKNSLSIRQLHYDIQMRKQMCLYPKLCKNEALLGQRLCKAHGGSTALAQSLKAQQHNFTFYNDGLEYHVIRLTHSTLKRKENRSNAKYKAQQLKESFLRAKSALKECPK